MKRQLFSLLIFLSAFSCFGQFALETFENTTGITGPLPAVWSLSTGNWAVFERNSNPATGTTQSWGINAFASTMPYQGVNSASVSREAIGMGNTSEDYLATPLITVPINGGALRFFTRNFTSGDQGTIFRICVNTNASTQTDPTAYTPIKEWTESNINTIFNVYEEKIVDLSAYAGQSIYIAFERLFTQPTSGIDGDRWIIDNVSMQSSADCNYPANLHAYYTSYTSLNLDWSNFGASNWEVLVLPCSEPAPTSTTNGMLVTTNTYTATNLTPGECYYVYIRTICSPTEKSPWFAIFPYLPTIGRFVLNAFLDTNNNGIKEIGESYFEYGSFTSVMNNAGATSYFTSNNGSYTIMNPVPLASYDFSYHIDPMYASYYALGTFNFNDIPTPDIGQTQILNFPITQTQDYSDLDISINSTNGPKAGSIDTDRLVLKRYGLTNNPSGFITYTKASNTTINAVNPSAGVTLTPTGFTYAFSNLNQSLAFDIYTDIPPIPAVNIGDVLQTTASVSVTTGTDVIPSNDSFALNQTVVAAFDPNEITEAHGNKIQFNQFSQNDYLYYTIHFQNTGNANTSTVKVEDILDSRIDESTISMITSSHNYSLQRTNQNLTWNFNNIALTPATTNETQSQGFIQYKVKLKPGFAVGDIIPNTASIYFDSNPPIITNTFNTEFVELLSINTLDNTSISLYPNPSSDKIMVTNSGLEKISKVSIYNVTGKMLYQLNDNNGNDINIDVSRFAKGIYLVELTSQSDAKVTKKLIIK